jgi:hypothetical protein
VSAGWSRARGAILARRRVIGVGALVALACLLALAASLSVWANRQLLDTDRWADQSGRLLESEAVRDAIAVRMVDALYAQGDVSAGLQERLPEPLDPLAVPIAGAIRQVALEGAVRLLERPGVQGLWTELNRRAHLRLVALLEGDEDALVRTADGNVVLDLQPLVDRLRQELGVGGRRPDGAAVITLMEADRLEAAQTAVRTVKVLSALLGLVVLGLLVLAVWLARGFRRQTVRAAAWGLLAAGLVLLATRRLAGDAVVAALASPASEAAAREVWTLMTTILRDLAAGLVALGALGVLWAFLAGGTRPAVWLRARLAPTMRARPAVVFAGALLGLLLLLIVGPVGAPSRLVGMLVLIALVMGGIEALRRQTVREFPDPP